MLPESCDPGYAQLGSPARAANTLAEQAACSGSTTVAARSTCPSGYVQPSQYPTAQELSAEREPRACPGQAYSAFGQQDVLATALQNALVAAAVANGEPVMAPHFLAKITDAQGRVVETYQPKLWKQAMSASAGRADHPAHAGGRDLGHGGGRRLPRAPSTWR